jgi:hypothetical protein
MCRAKLPRNTLLCCGAICKDAQRLGTTALLGAAQANALCGDTLYNYVHCCPQYRQYLPLLAFIGADKLSQPAKTEIQGELMVANRWQR